MSSWRRLWSGVVAGGLVAAGVVALPAPVSAQTAPSGDARAVEFSVGGLQPLQPARVLDTRATGNTVDALEQRAGVVGAGESRLLPLAGRGGVPVIGAGAVLLNVTVTQPAAAGHVTVFPAGAARPNSSNLNFGAGQTVPNLVLAKLGTGGAVQIASAASTHVIADVVGWVPEGPDVQPLQPARVLDTRGTGRTVDGQAQATGALGAGEVRRLPLSDRAGVPASGAAAVVLNLTATAPTRAGYLKAFPAGAAQPNASSLNFAAGQTVPNLVVAKVSADGAIDVLNSGGQTHVIADVVGWIPTGTSYGSLQPARVLDTRSSGATVDGQAQAQGALAAGEVRTLPVLGRAGVPAAGVGAVVLNTTVTGATKASHLTVFPTGSVKPNASNLNFGRGTTRANLVVAKVGSDGTISMVNAAGTTHVIADVVGWFPSGETATAGGVDSGQGSVRMVLPDSTELAGAGDVLSLTGTAAAPTQLRLAPSADVPPVGGHLVVMPNATVPDGTLVEVTSLTPQPDGSTTLGVQRAAVPAAFVDLEIDYKGPLALIDRPAVGPSVRTPSSVEARRDFGFGPMDAAGFTCTGEGGIEVSFDAGFQHSDAQINYDLTSRYLRFVVTTTPTITAGATATGAITCTREMELPGKLVLGPTGLALAVDLDLTAVMSGTITASASVGTPLTLGFEYSAGTVTNLSGASYTGSAGFGQQETEASISVTPSVEFDLEFLGAVEIGLLLGLPITGTLQPLATPCGRVDVAGSLGAEAEIELSFLPEIEAQLGQFDLGGQEIWSGDCKETDAAPGTWTGTISLSDDQSPYYVTTTGSASTYKTTRAYAASQSFTLDNTDLSEAAEDGAFWHELARAAGTLTTTPGTNVPTYLLREEYTTSGGSCMVSRSALEANPEWSRLRIYAASRDGRRLEQLGPGDTVLLGLEGSYGGDITMEYSASGDNPPTCPGGVATSGGMIDFPKVAEAGAPIGPGYVGSCPAGTELGFNWYDSTSGYCMFPVVLGPDRSISLSASISYDQLNWMKSDPEDSGPDATPVSLNVNVSLRFNP